MDLPLLSYQVDGISFSPEGHVSIQYADPDDAVAGVSMFRQLNVEAGVTEDIAQLTLEIMDAVCQLIDLAGVELRSPPPTIGPRRAVMGSRSG